MKRTQEAAAQETTENIPAFAVPYASEKLKLSILKVAREVKEERGSLKVGVKQIIKAIKKEEKGLVILAADVNPVDVISHVPILCEEKKYPYVWVDSKLTLSKTLNSRRPLTSIMICPNNKPQVAEKYHALVKILEDENK